MPAPSTAPSPKSFRPDIQALRAIAVLAVLVYHLWPNRFPGGYIGVDVFFVISGFLITSHLLRTLERDGRLQFGKFWANRVRRLIPLASLVLAVTLAGALLWMPPSSWLTTIRGTVASVLYVENWNLAGDAVDYLARDHAVGPTQQYWSLSVEEQFYIAWPLLLALAVYLGGRVARWRQANARHVLAIPRSAIVGRSVLAAMVVVMVGSFVYSLVLTSTAPGLAYFSTLTRAWEFAAGALLVFAGRALQPLLDSRGLDGWQAGASWVGGLAIVGGVVLLPEGVAFPGVAALIPVVGAALFLLGGQSAVAMSPAGLGRLRPVTYLGDISYGVYLWHWPLIVLLPYAIGGPLTLAWKLVVIACSVGLASLTKVAVEDRFRFGKRWTSSTARGFAPGLVAMGLVLVIALIPFWKIQNNANNQAEVVIPGLAGPSPEPQNPGQTESPSAPPVVEGPLIPTLALRGEDRGVMYDCFDFGNTKLYRCDYGPTDAEVTIAITGDSHAAHLIPGLVAAAESQGWRVSTFVGMACDGGPSIYCAGGQEMFDVLTTEDFDIVLAGTFRISGTPLEFVRSYWTSLVDAGVNLVVVEDVPFNPETVFACVDASGGDVALATDCRITRAEAFEQFPDRATILATELSAPTVSLNDVLCDESECQSVLGNVLVYQDSPSSHLTGTISGALGPRWEVLLGDLLPGVGAGSQ